MAQILLADDDTSMQTFLNQALTKAGHEVTICGNGLEALDHLIKGTAFDLLLTDIVMPGMDGFELAKKAGDLCPDMKVMFITGFTAVAMAEKESATTNAKLITKPFHLKDLVDQVNILLGAA